MTYSPGGPGYQPVQQPSAYAPTTQFPKPDAGQFAKPDAGQSPEPEAGPGDLPKFLLAGVAVIGLLVWIFAFFVDSVGASSMLFSIITVLLAALLAGVGLLPKQQSYSAVVAVIAVLGPLLLILAWVNATAVNWGFYPVFVLAVAQAGIAVGALLVEAGIITPSPPRPKYQQYPAYGAPAGYYGQPQQGMPPQPGAPQPGQPQQAAPTQQIPQQHFPQPQAPQQPPQQNYNQPPGYPSYGGYQASPATVAFPSPHTPQAPQAQPGPPTPPTGFPTYGPPPGQAPQQPEQQQEQQAQDTSAPSGPPPA